MKNIKTYIALLILTITNPTLCPFSDRLSIIMAMREICDSIKSDAQDGAIDKYYLHHPEEHPKYKRFIAAAYPTVHKQSQAKIASTSTTQQQQQAIAKAGESKTTGADQKS